MLLLGRVSCSALSAQINFPDVQLSERGRLLPQRRLHRPRKDRQKEPYPSTARRRRVSSATAAKRAARHFSENTGTVFYNKHTPAEEIFCRRDFGDARAGGRGIARGLWPGSGSATLAHRASSVEVSLKPSIRNRDARSRFRSFRCSRTRFFSGHVR